MVFFNVILTPLALIRFFGRYTLGLLKRNKSDVCEAFGILWEKRDDNVILDYLHHKIGCVYASRREILELLMPPLVVKSIFSLLLVSFGGSKGIMPQKSQSRSSQYLQTCIKKVVISKIKNYVSQDDK